MKMRELKRTYGTAVGSVWPAGVISRFGRPIAAGAGVLKSVTAVTGKRISIRIQDGDVEGAAGIEWDEPRRSQRWRSFSARTSARA
jgi:hypothetical protein